MLRRGLPLLTTALAVLATVTATWTVTAAASVPKPPPHYVAYGHQAVCGAAPAHGARCLSHIVLDKNGTPLASGGPASGSYGPTQLQSAYALVAVSGAGKTVALVDAYDNPDAASDLAAYRSYYGLPACTVANGCFRKLNETGSTSPLPRGNTGWGEEIDLDIELVSATCPSCHIVLVEASSASYSDLATAEDTAAKVAGVDAISNSYGGSEFSGETSDDVNYDHPGILITVSAGDSGYGVEYPAASQDVVAVGGTSLTPSTTNPRGWTETVWSGTGSGCSAYEPKPAWQTDTGCKKRTDDDVAAVADPNTGVAVYDSYGTYGRGRGADWYVFGGTSVASPIIASIGALAGAISPSELYAAPLAGFNHITTGSNGTCSPTYLCTGVAGYNGPTGLGTPVGTGAFIP